MYQVHVTIWGQVLPPFFSETKAGSQTSLLIEKEIELHAAYFQLKHKGDCWSMERIIAMRDTCPHQFMKLHQEIWVRRTDRDACEWFKWMDISLSFARVASCLYGFVWPLCSVGDTVAGYWSSNWKFSPLHFSLFPESDAWSYAFALSCRKFGRRF